MTKYEYSVEEVRRAVKLFAGYSATHHGIGGKLMDLALAFAERIEADESAVPVASLHADGYWAWNGTPPHESNYAGWRMDVFTHPSAQAAQVDDKVVVIRDGKSTTQGLVLAAAIYMGAVKDVFALRPDGPPYNERKVTKDAAALRAFDHLDAATKALRSAISHFAPTAEPVAQGEAGPYCERSDCPCRMAVADCRHKKPRGAQPPAVPDARYVAHPGGDGSVVRRGETERMPVAEILDAMNAAPSPGESP